MGEIMQWRLARAAQRRVPAPGSLVKLDAEVWKLDSPTQDKLKSLQQTADATNPAFVTYSNNLSDLSTLRQYLTTASPVFAALFSLDEWLASQDNRPSAKAFTDEVTLTVGPYLGKPEWQQLHKILAEIFYAALILSALNVPSIPVIILVEVLGLLARLLLVAASVDSSVGNTPTQDDIYNFLRWRTVVLPDWLTFLLLAIRIVKKAVIVRKPGFADLYVTREEWDHYEPAQIASIENIMAHELKSRVHVLVNQTKLTTTTEQSTTQLKEQDTTTTDLSQLQQQSSSDISIAAHIDGQVDTSGTYGVTQVNTHLGGSLDYSNASATSKATTQSHETVSRAVSRIEQTTRQVRTVSTLTREKDKEEHKFDNTQGISPVVGVYRWVDQIQNIELDRYPHRFLMEFEVPEPGAWTRWLHLNDLARNMANMPPVPFTVNGLPVTLSNLPLRSDQLAPDNYLVIAARYMTTGISPPPPDSITVALNLSSSSSSGAGAGAGAGSSTSQGDSSLSVPNGYSASSCSATAVASPAASGATPAWQIRIAVGAGTPGTMYFDPVITPPLVDQIKLDVDPISQGPIPVALEATAYSYEVNIDVTCNRLDQTYKQWQNDTYALIAGAYGAMLQAYNDEKAGLTIQQTNLADANSPAQNAQIVKQELKRQVIEMLIGTPFTGRNAINWDPSGAAAPTTELTTAVKIAPEIQFLEQAFEWENLSYICYPYYWADGRPDRPDTNHWKDLAVIQGNDSNFADFLRSGSARVVLPARPGFEDQVNFYVSFGILWGGGPMPAPGDSGYLSIADEIKAQQQRPLDVTVIDTWQVRLPTTLIWLQSSSDLPKNPSPTIDTTPKISSLSPASGGVGIPVTIAGTNFGDLAGTSIVKFNGTAATPTRWSATSIDVAVPPGATTGNVAVTVNGVVSNGVNFTVN